MSDLRELAQLRAAGAIGSAVYADRDRERREWLIRTVEDGKKMREWLILTGRA